MNVAGPMHTASSASRTNIAWRSDSVNNATVDRLSCCSKFISRMAWIRRIAASPLLTMAILSKRCSLLYLMVCLSLLVHPAQCVHDPCQLHDSRTKLVVAEDGNMYVCAVFRVSIMRVLLYLNVPISFLPKRGWMPMEMKRSTWGSQAYHICLCWSNNMITILG